MMWKCASCGGVYDPDQKGGYYHVCPDGTRFARNENAEEFRKGKTREEGGATKWKRPTG